MRHSLTKKVSLKNRLICLLLTVMMIVSLVAVGVSSAAAAGTLSTLYFDISKNTAWKPGSGEKLYATFTNSSGAQIGSSAVQLINQGTNLYSVAVPSGAQNVQLYLNRSGYTMLNSTPAAGYKRVFFNNSSAQWSAPMAYAWSGDGEDCNAAWHGVSMTRVGSTNYWYYDTRWENIIFNDNANTQTGDLSVSDDNLVCSGGTASGWDSVRYYKKYADVDISNSARGSGDELYAMEDGTIKFSKYPYSSSDPRAYGNGQQIYLYAPLWSAAYVTWDLDDPYNYTATMTLDSDGFYSAVVPKDARIKFYYNQHAVSNETYVPDGYTEKCYTMKNNANKWCEKKNATKTEQTDYTAPLESHSQHTTGSAFWVDAVYYDYLSDKELESGWLYPLRAGTGFNNSSNDWFEFKNFNSKISAVASNDSSNWRFPLYFGNLCGTQDAFDGNNAHDDYKGPNFWSNKGYMGPNITGLTNFDYAVNNSNGLWANGQDSNKSPDFNYSIRGLAYGSLDSDGSIQYAEGKKMPYFDGAWLKNEGIGKTVSSSFPFRQTPQGNGVTKYSFDSEGGTDNVFFNWDGTTPTSVGYSKESSYGVEDGLKYFMKDTGSGKGIFPFNSTIGNGGNNELDYGFGIKMDMDFRVPANGTLDGTATGSPVTFKYSGDDDLWVYLSEYDSSGALTNSQLVLDLGGSHKKAVGEINFKTMQATATKSMQPTETDLERDYVYIVDSYNWGDNLWIWAWNSDTDGKWYKAQYNSAAGCYRVGAGWGPYGDSSGDRFDSKTKFLVCNGKENWGSQTAQDTIVNHLGRMTYTDNLRYCADKAVSYSYNSTYTTGFGFASTGSDGDLAATGASNTLDPTKTYHMTVFYMERGMIESNCKIEFTMTPAQNDLRVKKEVNTADVNAGLRDAVKKQEFSFGNYVNGSLNTTASYTLNGQSARVDGGDYKLSDQDIADFDNQYETGSSIYVKETKPSSGVQYSSTTWEVVDNTKGDLIDSGSTAQTNAFTFANEDNSYVTRQVNFVNTPKVQDMTISKNVVDKNGNPVTSTDEFGFQLKVDLNGGRNYQAYKLKYLVNGEEMYTDNDGIFRFSAKDRVTFEGLPVGATFSLRELGATGYIPYKIKLGGSEQDFDGTIIGTIGSSASAITVTNKQNPVSTEIKARKFLVTKNFDGTADVDNYYVNGTLFNFTVEGLGETVYKTEGGESIKSNDASSMTRTISETDENGEVTFANNGGSDNFLSLTNQGAYIFKVSESDTLNKEDNWQTSAGDNVEDRVTYNADIKTDEQDYLALFIVEPDPDEPTKLVVSDPVYYYYPESGTVDASTFISDNEIDSDMPEFRNDVECGTVNILKTDGYDNPVDSVKFRLYKVSGDGDTNRDHLVDELETVDGSACFDNLDIYARNDDGDYEGEPDYQWYFLEESQTKDGHVMNKDVYYFTLPMIDMDSNPRELKYDVTFDYVNGVIKNPYTAGQGLKTLLWCGISIIALSGLMLLAYVLYFKKKKGYVPAHFKK